jgi:hypothetical protein
MAQVENPPLTLNTLIIYDQDVDTKPPSTASLLPSTPERLIHIHQYGRRLLVLDRLSYRLLPLAEQRNIDSHLDWSARPLQSTPFISVFNNQVDVLFPARYPQSADFGIASPTLRHGAHSSSATMVIKRWASRKSSLRPCSALSSRQNLQKSCSIS